MWPAYVNAESPSLRLECSFNRFRTDLVSVNELGIFRSDIGGGGEPEMVAKVTSANLTYGLNESDISASGQLQNNTKSNLFVSYTSNTEGYCQTYSCVAKGLKANGEEVSIYRPVKAKGMNNMPCKSGHRSKVPGRELGGRSSDCCVASEKVQAQSEAIESLENEIEKWSVVLPEVRNNYMKIELLRVQISQLENQASAESSIVTPQDNEKLENVGRRFDDLQKLVDAVSDENRGFRKILSIDVTLYEVSNIVSGRVYAVSKSEEMKHKRTIEKSCHQIGGYVAKIDDDAEQMFLINFFKMIGNYKYYIRAKNNEGNFVELTIGEPVSTERYAPGLARSNEEPRIVLGEKKDCVQAIQSGLINVECGQLSKFVCEVPMVEEEQVDNSQSGEAMIVPILPNRRIAE
ncbi:hypothetical protein PoB_000538000 [Plakobranchus ocellatus]|uniref:C-type lectin domain-containing protein n=1 Tax=Plakobranchus ocellatus TaxID=259542 RepID=A0AAV3Y6X9_9GAST|nr:hypothetical protein PoB_000538000 [Plakobranchus ocellatus]